MITEDYVSFETAKLLKKKGFDESTLWFYIGDGTKYLAHKTLNEDWYRRPTLQMAMKWLREVYHFHIEDFITTNQTKFQWKIYRIDNGSLYFSGGSKDLYYETYEEACEAAIRYCLENLI